MSENEGKGCCDEESDFCVGVTLQLFLSAILAGTFGCFYWVILPGWVEQGSVAVVLAGTSFGLCFTLMVPQPPAEDRCSPSGTSCSWQHGTLILLTARFPFCRITQCSVFLQLIPG